jgi:GT2 family glycosyltransferase
MSADLAGKLAVVIATRDRRERLLATLERLVALPERPRIVVADNGSTDGTAEAVARSLPAVELVLLDDNVGALARNVAVERLPEPYIAFADDDSWWEPGGLARAVEALEAYPRLAVITGRILIAPDGREDPICAEMRDSPLPADGLPGPRLVSFLAGASVLRRAAFLAAGGFAYALRDDGEEELLAINLAVAGWQLAYLDEVVVWHDPAPARDPDGRRRRGIRNTLWVTWLRRPLPSAARRTAGLLARVSWDRHTLVGLAEALLAAPRIAAERAVVPPHIERDLRRVDADQLCSSARSYRRGGAH